MKKAILLLVVFYTIFYQNLEAQSFFEQIPNCTAKGTAVDDAGNVYIVGSFTGSLTLGTTTLESAGAQDIFIAKYDATGTPLWSKRAGGTDIEQGLGIALSGSAVYITGSFQTTINFNTPSATGSHEITTANSGSIDGFVAKYDNTGAFQWAKRSGASFNAIAASGNEVYVTGSFSGTVNFNTPSAVGSNEITSAGSIDIVVAKYDDTGAFQWAKRGGASGADAGLGIAVSGTSVYITGYYRSTANFNTPSVAGSHELIGANLNDDVFVAKYNNIGVFQWAIRGGVYSGSPSSANDKGYAIAASGNAVYVTGSFVNGTADFNTPTSTTNNTVVSAGSNDVFLVKFNDAGVYQWARRVGGTGLDQSFGIALSGTSVYITGSFNLIANFNTPSDALTHTVTSVGGTDIYIAKFDDTGAFVSAQRAGGTGADIGNSIAVSGSTVYVVGTLNGGSSSFFASNLICSPTVSITASPSGTITTGTSVTFTATPTNGGTPTYQWEKNNVIVGTNSATYTDVSLVNNDVIKCIITSTGVCSYNVQATSTDHTMSVTSALPVELLDFWGQNTEGGNLLTWTTANEVNNKGFQVERLAPSTPRGGEVWDVLGFKTANNKSSTYDFTDNTPLPITSGSAISTSYYRLRQFDNDGKETLSKIISISMKGNNKLKVYPNPVSNILTIETGANDVFQIYNLLGQQVMAGKIPPSGARGLDVSALPEGSYFLKVGREQGKFVKQE